MSLLASIEFGEDTLVSRELVALIWSIPLFLAGGLDEMISEEFDYRTLANATTKMSCLVTEIIEGKSLIPWPPHMSQPDNS